MHNESILDKDVQELVSINIDELKNLFIEEIKALSSLSEEKRDEKISKMFNSLFELQPSFESVNQIHSREQRLFADLISIPEFYTNVDIRNFLATGDIFDDDEFGEFEKIDLLKRIFSFYDSASQEEINKFNYLFRSSTSVLEELINDDTGELFDVVVNLMNYFDKEDFIQIVKFLVGEDGVTSSLVNGNISHERLFVISVMNKKMKQFLVNTSGFLQLVGNSYEYDEYFESIIPTFYDDDDALGHIICDFYDKYIGSRENEEEFLNKFLNEDGCLPLTILMESIISHEIFKERFKDLDNFDKFLDENKLLREEYHNIILNTNVDSSFDLNSFKKAFFYNVYGMSSLDVSQLVKMYGVYLDDTFDDISEEDKKGFLILKALKDIDNLTLYDEAWKEKVLFLQKYYVEYVRANGLEKRNKLYSYIVLDGLFSEMFLKTYNKRLLKKDKCHFIESDDGIPILDSGNKFHIMLTSLEGVYESFYNKNLNMASKWNTSFNSTRQGISMSCITNENVGVFSLDSPLLGFDNLPDYSLVKMGVSDIFSKGRHFNLRSSGVGYYKKFVPASVIDDETRYGFNEFLIERFLNDDKEGKLKLQPNFVVFYKFDENYKDSEIYKKSLKTAKDFNIPIVMIDIPKMKENEEREINLLKEELLNGNDPSKIKDVLVRYMNNYTGSLVLNKFTNEDDFSIEGMKDFFDRIFVKIRKIKDLSLKRQWVDSLEKAYLLESDKYESIKNISHFRHSVTEFILLKYKIKNRINTMKKNLKSKEKNEFIEEEIDYTVEKKTLMEFTNRIGLGTAFQVIDDEESIDRKKLCVRLNENEKLFKLENVVMSYFFESENNLIEGLIDSNFQEDISFKCSDGDNSNLFNLSNQFSDEDLEFVINRVESISNYEFLNIFASVIDKYAVSNNKRFEDVASNLLDKKKYIRESFKVLSKSYDNSVKK